MIKGNISVPSQGDRCVLAADGIITRVPGLQAASGGQSWANDEGSSECRRCFDKSLCKFTSPAKLPITGRALHVQVDSTRSSGGSVAGPEPHGHVDVSCKTGGTVEGRVSSLVGGGCVRVGASLTGFITLWCCARYLPFPQQLSRKTPSTQQIPPHVRVPASSFCSRIHNIFQHILQGPGSM